MSKLKYKKTQHYGNYYIVTDDSTKCICMCTCESNADMILKALNARTEGEAVLKKQLESVLSEFDKIGSSSFHENTHIFMNKLRDISKTKG